MSEQRELIESTRTEEFHLFTEEYLLARIGEIAEEQPPDFQVEVKLFDAAAAEAVLKLIDGVARFVGQHPQADGLAASVIVGRVKSGYHVSSAIVEVGIKESVE